MKHICVYFGPTDVRNPEAGYDLRIEDAFSGRVLLRTASAPDTGSELKSPADCLRVVGLYVKDDDAQG